MSDIELVIKIPEEVYRAYKMDSSLSLLNADQKSIAESYLINGLINSTPLPKGHGAKWINNKCSTCGKGIEDLIDSREWYENEKPSYCPFCGKRFKESE